MERVARSTGGLVPDLTLLLDVDVEIGLRRSSLRHSQGGEWNRLDAYQLEFHRRVRAGYLELAKQEPNRWVLIDASQAQDHVQSALRTAIMERLE